MVAPPTTPRSFAVDVARVSASFQDLARQMGSQFLDKQEIIRLMTISAIAGEHMVIVGPPGTAKSAMIDMFARLIDARYFEYLLTRFTEPNELFGPVDISAFREGRYTRRLEHMLPTAESVSLELRKMTGRGVDAAGRQHGELRPVTSARELRAIQQNFDKFMVFPEEFLTKYKGLIFQIRSEGISVSDRRAVKLLKLFAASAVFDGRTRVHDGDFFVLRHIWNNLDQVELLDELINPVVDAYYRVPPDERRFIGPPASLDDLLTELGLIRELLTSGAELSDIQLFSQLKNLNEIKVALAALPGDAAARMIREVDQLLETVFASSKFGL